MNLNIKSVKVTNNINIGEKKEFFLECEKFWVFATLMFIGGFYGAFTYSIRGGVFCNAQTANFVLFAMNIGNANFSKAGYYLIPMTAYLLGTIISEAIAGPIRKKHFIRWDTILIFIEMLAVIFLGFLPESAPFQISQITINFICSMQYNTFRQAQKMPMATTFCTNHVRQTGISIVKTIKDRKNKEKRKKLLMHVCMLLMFVVGGIISTVLCNIFLGKAIWVLLIPLSIIFIDLLYADLKKERKDFNSIPHGH